MNSLEDNVVTPIPDQWVLVHEPSGAAFDSIIQLVAFHRGWQAARAAEEVSSAASRRLTAKSITVDVIDNGMSQPSSNADTADESDDRIAGRILRQDEFAGNLNAQGYTDVLVLRRENGRDVLTESRLELVGYLDRHGDQIESVRDLARKLDRDKGAVSKDLRRLAELDIVEYEGEGDGEAKRPGLKHEHVVIEPVVY